MIRWCYGASYKPTIIPRPPARNPTLAPYLAGPGSIILETLMSKQIKTNPMPTMTAEQIARFYSRIDKRSNGECWPWTARVTEQGYGAFSLGSWFKGTRRSYVASRVAYYLHSGTDPQGLCVCHRCDNRPCCNPAHLWVGTCLDNNLDMKAKGRLKQGNRKLEPGDVRRIRKLYKAGGVLERELGAMFGVTRENISLIITGRNWASVK